MINIKLVFTLALLLWILPSFGQEKSDCQQVFKRGKFKYLDAIDSSTYIVMNGATQIEYSVNGKYTIESKIDWISDCSYYMTMTKITVPNFPFKPGDVMKVDITKIEGNTIYYNSTVKDQSLSGRFVKIVE
jgi:hypothetical protein